MTIELDFHMEAVEEALAKYGRPGIFTTDEGSKFTAGPAGCAGDGEPHARGRHDQGRPIGAPIGAPMDAVPEPRLDTS